MNYKELMKDIKNNNLKNFNIIYGDESYNIDNCIKLLVKSYVDSNLIDLNYIKYESVNDNIDEFIEAITTYPFMAERKVVVVENSDFLTSSSSNKLLEDKLLELYKSIDSTIIVFIIKNKKPDMRKKLVKSLKKDSCLYEVSKLKEGELTNYIIDKFKKSNITINSANASYIAMNCGYLEKESFVNLLDVNNEIKKLLSYCYKSKNVSKFDIDKLLIKSMDSNIFKLIDLICDRRKKEAKIMLDDMIIKGAAEQYIIYMIVRQIRQVHYYHVLKQQGHSLTDIMSIMKIPRFIAVKLSSISDKINIKKVENLLEISIDIERKIKTGLMDKTYGLDILYNSF